MCHQWDSALHLMAPLLRASLTPEHIILTVVRQCTTVTALTQLNHPVHARALEMKRLQEARQTVPWVQVKNYPQSEVD